jgi:hypothetical protein
MRIFMDIYHDYARAYPLSEKLVEMHPDNLFFYALYLKIKDQLGKITAGDQARYAKVYKNTHFINKQAARFFSDWKNIK